MIEVGKLEDEAIKRKERLKSLKQKRGSEETGPPGKRQANESLPKPVFRSYKPKDEKLTELQLAAAPTVDVEQNVQDQLEASKPEPLVEEIDLINLAPRKPDWDLKRDISKKLERLERRTKKAMAEIVRDRLKTEQDLTVVVEVGDVNEDLDED